MTRGILVIPVLCLVSLGFAVDVEANGEHQAGIESADVVSGDESNIRVDYLAYRFEPQEGWTLRAHGAAGQSRLDGRILRLDFTQGASAFSLIPPDRSLPGNVDRLALRLYGSPRDLPVRLQMRTHFMTFQKDLGRLSGDGHLEVATDGPPGPGWEWLGGENDGKLHGPLRLGAIRFERPPRAGLVDLELEDIAVGASCPADKRCLASAAVIDGTTGPEFKFEVRALTDETSPAKVRWELKNWEGEILGRGRSDLEIQPFAVPAEFHIGVPQAARERWRFIEAEFHLEGSGQVPVSAHAAWVAPVENGGDAVLRPDSPFGMGAYFYRYPANEEGYAEMTRAAAVAQAVGVKWTREEFQWNRIEPRRGEFEWEFYDRMVSMAHRHGIQVYAIVAYWSDWTRPYTPEGIADYVRYLEALVKRYGAEIRHWEIWNEPNIFFWQGPKDLYADLLKRSYAAVKALDPEAQVLGLSTAGIDFDYIRRMLELGAPFDILTIHPYRRTLDDRAFLDDLRRVSDLVGSEGRRRPVWLTELGWATYSPHNTLPQDFAPTTLREQAELLARCYLIAMVSGVEPLTFWYNFRNDGEDPFYFEHHMGIVDRQFRPKPAYRAYAVMTRVLSGFKATRQLDLSGSTMAWRFEGIGETSSRIRRVDVLWNPRQDELVTVPVDFREIRRVNAMGEESELEAHSGKVEVPLRKGAVVYLFE